ncbi:response regulator transcription factor [Cohnella caldifontis]|uniref:response regulator transcription factor n=1 Tax=Cohnella caldifontis TaxID=3027471 RepID=UPI0023EDD36B|nr:response regulator [Cohnella sp. YIM B05605]
MLRVLVVDDEPRQRKILSSIIHEFRAEYEMFEAKNGEEALGICTERKMDIVFSDIRMPKLDGLSLIENIYGHNPQSKIVIVSGYSDFAYARRALDLRVHGYILKPIQRESIQDSLRQIEEEIRKDRSSRQEKEAMAVQLHKLKPLYSDLLLNKWLKGEHTQSEREEIEALLGPRGCGCAILSRIGSPEPENGAEFAYTPEERNEIKWNIRTWVNETLRPYGRVVSFFMHQNADEMASLIVASAESELRGDSLLTDLRTLADHLFQEYGISMSFGVGQAEPDILTSVPSGFRTAEAALRCRFYLSDQKAVRYSDIQDRYSEERKGSFPIDEDFKPIVHAQKPLSMDVLDRWLEKRLGDRFPEPELLLDDVRRQLLQLLHDVRNIVPEDTIGDLARKINQRFHPAFCPDLQTFKKHGVKMLGEMAAAVQLQKDNKNYIVMERCLHYVHGHFGEELSLEELSKKYYFNPSYFSTLFKKYTGKHFTEYVTDLRVEIARKILLESDKKIYEVAREVGYRDVKYFNKIFKKRYGLTPEECRIFGKGRE